MNNYYIILQMGKWLLNDQGVMLCINTLHMLSLGPPPPPSNLSITPHNLNTILISWSQSQPPFGIPVMFHVRQVGKNDQTTTNATSLLVTHNRTSCGILKFYVSASNPAGISTSSPILSPVLICESWLLQSLITCIYITCTYKQAYCV